LGESETSPTFEDAPLIAEMSSFERELAVIP